MSDAAGRDLADTLPRGPEKATAVRAMFDGIAPRYDVVNRLLTFGLDVRWRRRAVTALGLAPGSRVVDLGAGTGDLCRELERWGMRTTGVDLSMGMLRHARTDAPRVQADVLHLPLPDGCADGATCGFTLRNLVDLDGFLAELGRVVRPSGRIALLEVDEPTRPLLRWGHRVWFGRVTPLVGGWLSDGDAYRYLPRSVVYLPPPARLVAMVEEAGFTAVTREPLSGGVAQLLTGTRT